jgi:hypothetical protein
MIMPISTPEEYQERCGDDSEHFLHVMECLFTPAIEKANFRAISPVSEGSQQIHAKIISEIEKSDLVLCDMSTLNANVFFELGIRTALNKPVCFIKDDLTTKIPFDTNTVHYHTYSSNLASWIVKEEIEKLSKHITNSFNNNNTSNELWKYFSLRNIAQPLEAKGEDARLEFLSMQLDGTRRQMNNIESLLKKSINTKSTQTLNERYPRIFYNDSDCDFEEEDIQQQFERHINHCMNHLNPEYYHFLKDAQVRDYTCYLTLNKVATEDLMVELKNKLGHGLIYTVEEDGKHVKISIPMRQTKLDEMY